MSGTVGWVSPFLSTNDLLKPGEFRETQMNNALLRQREQQGINATNLEMISRASAYLDQFDEAKQAELYPGVVSQLQSNGFAMNAPTQYPGKARIAALKSMGTSVAQQYQLGLLTTPEMKAAIENANRPLPLGGGGGTASPGGGTSEFNFGNIRPAGATTGFNTYATPQDGIAAMSSNLAAYANQHGINTLNGLTARWAPKGDGNNDPVAYASALGKALGIAPDAEINLADPMLQTRLIPAMAQIEKGRPFNQPANVLTAGIQAGLSGRGGAPVPPSGGVAARTGGTDVAGPPSTVPAQTPPGGATATPIGQPAPASQQIAPATGGTGVNSPQFQAALELNRRAQALELAAPADPRAKAMAASLRAQAALYMQADSVSVDPATGIQTKQLTGERLNAAAPNAHYVWNGQSYVDTTGTHPPVTPPSPRLQNVEGVGVVQSKPGGGAELVYPFNPAGMTQQKAAEAQGTAAGKAAGGEVPALAEQGRNAAQAIGNIDYGMARLREAKAAGIPSGYYAESLATLAAKMKSLGIPTSIIGVDPAAVGDVQTAQKTLGIVAGAILQQAIGKGGQITDAKIEHFIHTQPSLLNDPDALDKILNWARSQFVYEAEMSRAGMDEASKSQTGTLPMNWRPNYFRTHGFAPIYNPETREMEQPEGQPVSRKPPPDTTSIAPAVVKSDADFNNLPSGTQFVGPDGKLRRKP